METGIRAIVTGATGMVGEGLMHQCLQDPNVEQVLVINRKASGGIASQVKRDYSFRFF
jgi:nucleoside-diphosphate-sugar epimerase